MDAEQNLQRWLDLALATVQPEPESLPVIVGPTASGKTTLAIRLAHEREAHAALRSRLATNRLTTPLFDSRSFVRHLEAGYEAMWQRAVAGLPPDHIDVPR